MEADDARADCEALLLNVCATPDGTPAARFAALEHAQWDRLVAMADEKRAVPLLQRSIAGSGMLSAMPQAAAARLAGATRRHTLYALAQARATARAVDLLAEAGLRPIALKGCRLAFSDFPQAALRPLRDLDLLLTTEQAEQAQSLLLASGAYILEPEAQDYGIEYGHQLPGLLDLECEVKIEIHHRLNARGWGGDAGLLDMVRKGAEEIEVMGRGVLVPSLHANLLHIVEHATIHHMFNNGPLLLADLHFMAASGAIDWPRLIAEAQLLGLFRALCLTVGVARSFGAEWIPDELLPGLDEAQPYVGLSVRALLQSDEAAEQQAFLRRQELRSERVPGWKDALARALRPDPIQLAAIAGTRANNPLRWLGYPGWLVGRGAMFLKSSGNRQMVEASSAQLGMLQWLQQK